jgi:galactokinase
MSQQFFAPGRVNLIGEHLDYNGGLVLPAALTIGIKAAYEKRDDNKIVLRSQSHPFSITINTNDDIQYNPANEWTNYPLGVIDLLRKQGRFIPACEITYSSNLPEGSGLSSSAAIEVVTAFLLLSQTEKNIELPWLAGLCKQVENEFIGMNCGIMDQFSVALGKADHAILLDCSTLQHVYIPFQLKDYRLVIMDTKKPRTLITSKYNERREQCEEALRIIQTASPIKNLCQADMDQLALIKDDIIKRRARHVISENLRVKESVKALRFNDLSAFGRMMNASHKSLKYDFDVTGPELDTLVAAAQNIKGCLGARMTGGGFAGSAIALVHKQALEKLKNSVSAKYLTSTGRNCDIYESEIGEGVRQFENSEI